MRQSYDIRHTLPLLIFNVLITVRLSVHSSTPCTQFVQTKVYGLCTSIGVYTGCKVTLDTELILHICIGFKCGLWSCSYQLNPPFWLSHSLYPERPLLQTPLHTHTQTHTSRGNQYMTFSFNTSHSVVFHAEGTLSLFDKWLLHHREEVKHKHSSLTTSASAELVY